MVQWKGNKTDIKMEILSNSSWQTTKRYKKRKQYFLETLYKINYFTPIYWFILWVFFIYWFQKVVILKIHFILHWREQKKCFSGFWSILIWWYSLFHLLFTISFPQFSQAVIILFSSWLLGFEWFIIYNTLFLNKDSLTFLTIKKNP